MISVIGSVFHLVTALTLIGGALIAARSAWMIYTLLQQKSGAVSLWTTALKYKQAFATKFSAAATWLATTAQWAYNLALSVFTVKALAAFAVITLVAGAAYLIYQNWGQIKIFFASMWDSIGQGLSTAWQGIKAVFGSLLGWAKTAGIGFVQAILSGIMTGAKALYSGVSNVMGTVRKYLPFSDAKLGPLSKLTQSGQRFVTTFAGGVESESARAASSTNSSLHRFADPKNVARDTSGSVSPQFTINIENLIGRLSLGNREQGQGNLQFLAASMAQALSAEIQKHEEFA